MARLMPLLPLALADGIPTQTVLAFAAGVAVVLAWKHFCIGEHLWQFWQKLQQPPPPPPQRQYTSPGPGRNIGILAGAASWASQAAGGVIEPSDRELRCAVVLRDQLETLLTRRAAELEQSSKNQTQRAKKGEENAE